VPAHLYHEALAGFDERQILHDGCQECEFRGRNLSNALAHMDPTRFAAAWKRAYDVNASDGDHDAVGPLSHAENDLLDVLWGIQVHLQRSGYQLDGRLPQQTRRPR